MTLIDRIALADLDNCPSETGAPDPTRLIRGSPRHRTWIVDERDSGKTFAGV